MSLPILRARHALICMQGLFAPPGPPPHWLSLLKDD